MKSKSKEETPMDFSIYLYSGALFFPPIVINMIEGDLRFNKSESLFKNLAEAFLDHAMTRKIDIKEVCLKVYDSLNKNRLSTIYSLEEL